RPRRGRGGVVGPFPDRRVGPGLYAFVEGDPGLTEHGLREFLAAETAAKTAPKSPEHLQLTGQLPRAVSGEVRSEILELVAMNQVDLIESLIASDDERVVVARIVADRRNLRDGFAFQPTTRRGRRAARQMINCRRQGAIATGTNGS